MINLVPKEIKDKARVKSFVFGLIALYIFSLAIILIGAAGLFAYNIVQKSNLETKKQQLAALEAEKQKNKDTIEKAAFIENRLRSVSNYTESGKWEEVLEVIAQSMPTDLSLSELKITDEKNQIILGINGATLNRRSIILFKDKLNTSESIKGAYITTIAESTQDKSQTKKFTFTINAQILNKVKQNADKK